MVAYPGGAEIGTVLVYLKLDGCPEVRHEFHSPLKMRRYFKRAITKVNKTLVEQAAKDRRMNVQFRESIRLMLLKQFDYQTTSSAAALFAWLVLHDVKDGAILRAALTNCLKRSRYAVISIGRSKEGLYVTNVGNKIPDLTAQLQDRDLLNFRPQTIH